MRHESERARKVPPAPGAAVLHDEAEQSHDTMKTAVLKCFSARRLHIRSAVQHGCTRTRLDWSRLAIEADETVPRRGLPMTHAVLRGYTWIF